jgi:hypothetical protein
MEAEEGGEHVNWVIISLSSQPSDLPRYENRREAHFRGHVDDTKVGFHAVRTASRFGFLRAREERQRRLSQRSALNRFRYIEQDKVG